MNIKITSPDGKATIMVHPSKLDQMINDGWTKTDETNKIKSNSGDKKPDHKKEQEQ